jgi:hypothetical protein
MGEKALAGWGLSGASANFHGNKGQAIIKIPSGHHELIASFYMGNGQKHAIKNDINISYDFVAGHTYRLKATLYYKPGLFSKNKELTAMEDYSLNSINYNLLDSISIQIEEK